MTDWQRKYEEASAAAAIMGIILYTLGVVVVTVGLTMAVVMR